MKDKKETRGGLRWNSATLHQARKPLDHICAWCNDSFTSTGNKEKGDRYCSDHHRINMFNLKQAIDNKKRVTKRMRKRHTFRPEVWRA